jgi:hypothetical protein
LRIGLQAASVINAPTWTLDYTLILITALADQGLHYSATVSTFFHLLLGLVYRDGREDYRLIFRRWRVPLAGVAERDAARDLHPRRMRRAERTSAVVARRGSTSCMHKIRRCLSRVRPRERP